MHTKRTTKGKANEPYFKDLQPLKPHPDIRTDLSVPSSLSLSISLPLSHYLPEPLPFSPPFPFCLSFTLPTTYTSKQPSGFQARPEITPPPVSGLMVSLVTRTLSPLLHNSLKTQCRAHTQPGQHLLPALCTHFPWPSQKQFLNFPWQPPFPARSSQEIICKRHGV